METKFCFAIDRGGTFTDVYARCPGGKVQVMKLLSEDPSNYADAPTEGIRRIIEQVICRSRLGASKRHWNFSHICCDEFMKR